MLTESELKDLFSRRLSKLMKSEGLNQNDLARIVGVSESTVGKWVLKKSLPRMGAIQKLADHFGVGKSYFLEQDQVLIPADPSLPMARVDLTEKCLVLKDPRTMPDANKNTVGRFVSAYERHRRDLMNLNNLSIKVTADNLESRFPAFLQQEGLDQFSIKLRVPTIRIRLSSVRQNSLINLDKQLEEAGYRTLLIYEPDVDAIKATSDGKYTKYLIIKDTHPKIIYAQAQAIHKYLYEVLGLDGELEPYYLLERIPVEKDASGALSNIKQSSCSRC